MASAEAMEVDEQSTDNAEEKSLPPISFGILQLIKVAQKQHGLRHKDYQRYRQYCMRRLRRLYKSLKFLHGRGTHKTYPKGKEVTAAMVTEVR
ncbi:hypothetical protein KFL_004690100 [Klebsormidium nitens]|uniref:Signal recognition particle subunit SRP68 n=1 Tax=Klebsormidium nitens TaxID=105231 RepID=A0A1Y1ILC9_KLENI|nr:hypothetical protein KFL_004690100 [Klebsormidium nitens]|eukprot:GAQ88918.1 hypothetical protein KFL_004690100 [Klebsormidium nitens]